MKNMGLTDRRIRAVVGVILIVLALLTGAFGVGTLKWVMTLIGVVMVATAAIGVCPAYLPFGINTCNRR